MYQCLYTTILAREVDFSKMKKDSLKISNAAHDAVANDIKYHLNCYVVLQREAKKANAPIDNTLQQQIIRGLMSDMEIIKWVSAEILCPSGVVLDTSTVHQRYQEILLENGASVDYVCQNRKFSKHLKTLLIEHVPFCEFVAAKNPAKPDNICSKKTITEAVEDHKYDIAEVRVLYEAAHRVREDIQNLDPWLFEGSYDTFVVPDSLKTLIKWVTIGPFKASNA